MKYFKNAIGNVFAYANDDERNTFGAVDMLPMTAAEVDAHINPPSLSALPKQFTSLEFLDLFTGLEQLAIVQAGMVSAQVKLWYDRALAASFISLSDPRTEGGINALVLAGLITPERRAEIMEAMQ